MDEDFEMPPVGGMNDDDMDFGDASSFLKVGEEKEIQQGLKKKLLKEGEGFETPENGDEVEGIYYILRFKFIDFRFDFFIDLFLQCITRGLCSMGPSSIPAATGARLSVSLSGKVCDLNLLIVYCIFSPLFSLIFPIPVT